MVEGFDISGNSGFVDFPAARLAGKEFCFMRVGRGIPASGTDTAGLDNRWLSYVQSSRAAGFHRGGYWRFFPSRDMMKQVIAFCSRLELAYPLELPPLVDIEDAEGLPRPAMTDWAVRVLSEVESLMGIVPFLYTNKSFLADKLDPLRVARWPLALARWTLEPAWPDERAVFWQYTGNSRVPWATGPVDLQRTK